ncbi:MAG TPA: gluconokinase [Myxococcales bacterium]
MGVCATGKTAVATLLAQRLGLDFVEGDAHHPASNVAKMESGLALTDEDRWPWLRTLAGLLEARHAAGRSTVLTCSALRRSYRDLLRRAVPAGALFFLHLHAPFAVLSQRMSGRSGHFMPESLLQSQLDTLEELQPDERGATLEVSGPLDAVVAEAFEAVEVIEALRTGPGGG